MTTRRSRGMILGLVVLLVPLLFVLTMAVGTMGITHLSLQKTVYARAAATEAAQAGLAAGVEQLGQDNTWTGFQNQLLSQDPPTRYSVTLVNNLSGTTNKMAGTITVPPGYAYLTSTGTYRGGYAQRASAMVQTAPEFPYAIASGNVVNIASVNSVAGSIKANASMLLGVALLQTQASSVVVSGGNISNVALITMNGGRLISRGWVALPLLVLGASQLSQSDTSDLSQPFLQDGRIKNNPPTGREILPNPDRSKLLKPGTYQAYTGFQEFALLRGNGNFNLNNKVHYFPDGVRFGLGSVISGTGTIVVGNGKKAEFTIAITDRAMNVIAHDSGNGTTGGATISFTGLTSIRGLVYCQGKIESLVGLSVTGKIIAYGPNARFDHLGGLLSVTNGSMRHIAPGFSPWLTGGNDRPVVVRGWAQ